MVGSIVALRDGIITELTVTRGSAACKIGQAVRKGQTLISGYTDCGLTIRAEQADGEVFAQTQQSLTAKIPSQSTSRGEIREENKKYSLIIGKKRINLYKGSGISDTGCVKIYSVGYITLPGGFQLPVAIVTERFIYYDTNESFLSQKDGTQILSDFARQYLNSHMVAGQILTKTEDYAADGSCLYLTGNYACLEMIGIMRSEENIKAYGEHD